MRYALPHLSGDALPNLNNCSSHFPSAFCVARANCPCESLRIFRCARATHTMLKSQHSASPLVNPTLQAKCHAIHHKPKRPFFIWVRAELHKHLSHMRSTARSPLNVLTNRAKVSSSPHRHVTIVLSVRCHRTSSSGIKRYLLYAMACDITHIYHNHSSFTDLMLARCSHFLHMLSMSLVL